ncbi:LamG-like jellyroll fold domain-containing protein [Geoalkalibacter halelectricus]|uniref:LamG-like jellyroll fold domain-containing protein n=1 Tax=Geoalkalibacter halelectricus TaxID=2847045 RepID=UPI003D22D5C8
MKKTLFFVLGLCALVALNVNSGNAALIAQYTFDDFSLSDSSGSATAYNLTAVGAAPNLSKQAYFSDGSADNYLQVAGPGGMPDWTLSLWVNTRVIDQGTFKALFSNNIDANADFSWQIDSHNGEYRLVSRTTTNNPTIIIGAPTFDTWENIIVQKFGGNNARVFFNGDLVGLTGFNPGGLQNFRIGINRNSNQSFLGYLDNIQIWDDSQVDPWAIFQAGPGAHRVDPIPEPSTLLLLGGGLLGVAFWRRRQGRTS